MKVSRRIQGFECTTYGNLKEGDWFETTDGSVGVKCNHDIAIFYAEDCGARAGFIGMDVHVHKLEAELIIYYSGQFPIHRQSF